MPPARRWIQRSQVEMTFPKEGEPGFERLDLKATRGGQKLSYDYGDLVRLFSPDDEGWSIDLYYLEYDQGNREQVRDLLGHAPEDCMRTSGARMERELPPFHTEVEGRELSCRQVVLAYPHQETRHHVFKIVWMAEMGRFGIEGQRPEFRLVRLTAAWRRHPRPPARLILASVTGVADAAEARSVFEREILSRCAFTSR